MKLTIYGLAEGCAPCKEAVRICEENGIEHDFFAVDDNQDLRAMVKEAQGSVPYILEGSKVIGGRDELIVWVSTNWNMTFDQFAENVLGWSKDRGILAHSTATAQLLKGVSELGELADETIKLDMEKLKDAIGDTAVCLINYGHMAGVNITGNDGFVIDSDIFKSADSSLQHSALLLTAIIGDICFTMATGLREDEKQSNFGIAMVMLRNVAKLAKVDFDECCRMAWLEIKDRKGHMVAGGAFVKDE